jgi:hypothetical protein
MPCSGNGSSESTNWFGSDTSKSRQVIIFSFRFDLNRLFAQYCFSQFCFQLTCFSFSATSFAKTPLQPILPLLESMPSEFHVTVPYLLSFVMGMPYLLFEFWILLNQISFFQFALTFEEVKNDW